MFGELAPQTHPFYPMSDKETITINEKEYIVMHETDWFPIYHDVRRSQSLSKTDFDQPTPWKNPVCQETREEQHVEVRVQFLGTTFDHLSKANENPWYCEHGFANLRVHVIALRINGVELDPDQAQYKNPGYEMSLGCSPIAFPKGHFTGKMIQIELNVNH